MIQEIFIDEKYNKCRIDISLSEILGITRSQIKKLIDDKCVFCNDEIVSNAGFKLQEGFKIKYKIEKHDISQISKSDIKLDIVFEDEYLIVVNKPVGMVVHPAPGNYNDTLVNALVSNYDIENVGDATRPGIVHRIDKDTSGLMIVAKTNEVHHELSKRFKPSFEDDIEEKQINRTYFALVYGRPNPAFGTIETKIARHHVNRQKMCNLSLDSKASSGKLAITNYVVEETWNNKDGLSRISLVRFNLLTGRTHQIRLHCQFIKTPIIGDQLYGIKNLKSFSKWTDVVNKFPRQALHAKEISFIHPITNEDLFFEVDFPEDINNLINFISDNSLKNLI